MRFIPTRIHGMIDYTVGILLVIVPYVLGFADGTAAQYVPQLLGLGAIVYSLVTRYELGAMKLLPMPAHLGLDFASGVLLALSPWLFGFAGEVYWPHLIVGILEIIAALTTETRPRSTSPV